MIQFIGIENGDMSYQVFFTVQNKNESDIVYSKLCGLDRSQLPVYCIQTKNLEVSQEDNVTDNYDNKEIMDTIILNEEFYVILNSTFPVVLKGPSLVPLTKECRVNRCNFDDYSIDKQSTDAEICKPCNDESLHLSQSESSDGSATTNFAHNNIFHQYIKKHYTHYFTMSGCVQLKNIVELRPIF